jgi:hypothetical protein
VAAGVGILGRMGLTSGEHRNSGTAQHRSEGTHRVPNPRRSHRAPPSTLINTNCGGA